MKKWLKNVGNTITNAVDTAASAVQNVVNGAGNAVADVFETMGNGIQDGCNALGGALSGIPGVGSGLNKFFRWTGSVASASLDLVGAVVGASFGVFAGLLAGGMRIVGGGIGGLLSGNGRVALKGLGDVFSPLAGRIILVAGRAVSWGQTVLGVERERALKSDERAALERVFRKSVALYNVRVVEGKAGVFSVNSDPFTLGNKIYMKDTSPGAWLKTLVHECTHVWQYEHLGARYTSDALWAQNTPNKYNWRAEMDDGKTHWVDFNREAEAEFVEDVFRLGRTAGSPATGTGEFYEDDPVGPKVEFLWGQVDLTRFAGDTTAYVRGKRSWRLSQFI